MPDGIVIRDVPDGTTQAELSARLERMRTGGPSSPSSQPSLAQRAISAVSAQPGGYGIPRELTQFAAAAPIPTLTTGIGAALGGVPGAMIGGGLGEAANQQLGITEPSGTAIGLNTAAPVVGRYIQPVYQAAKRGLTHILPGAGLPLQERAAGMAKDLTKIGAPETASGELYQQLEQHNPLIDATPFKDSLLKMKVEVTQRLGDSPEKTRLLNYLQSKYDDIAASPDNFVPFQRMRSTMKELNAKIGAKEGGEELGILKQLKGGLKESLAKSKTPEGTTPEAVNILRQANAAFAKEQGQAELDKAITKSMVEHEGGVQTFSNKARENLKKVLNTNEDIKSAYSKEEIGQMKQALDAIGSLPGLPPNPETLYGGLRYSGPAVVGGVLASQSGGIHPLVGATAGMTIDLALRKVVGSEWGRRKVIEYATETGKKVPPEVVMSIASGLMAGIGGVVNPAESSEIKPPPVMTPRSTTQRHAEILQTLPKDVQAWMKGRPEASMTGILSNMRSMTPDEQQAYGRSLVTP